MKTLYSFALALFLFAGNASAQQIPNGSFENWGSNGNPVSWTTNNQPPFVEMVTKSASHKDGAFSARGEVKEFLPGQTAPPMLYSGTGQTAGFPINARPGALNGYVATDLKASDLFLVSVTLTKEQQPVAVGTWTLSTSAQELQPFSVPLVYVDDSTPDTAMITIMIYNQASPSPTIGSSFTIDALSFGAGSADVDQTRGINDLSIVDRGRFHEVSFDLASSGYVTLEVADINGRSVARLFEGVASNSRVHWDSGSLPSGLYLCRLTSEQGAITRKISIVR